MRFSCNVIQVLKSKDSLTVRKGYNLATLAVLLLISSVILALIIFVFVILVDYLPLESRGKQYKYIYS